jgi:hypothetical protein
LRAADEIHGILCVEVGRVSVAPETIRCTYCGAQPGRQCVKPIGKGQRVTLELTAHYVRKQEAEQRSAEA